MAGNRKAKSDVGRLPRLFLHEILALSRSISPWETSLSKFPSGCACHTSGTYLRDIDMGAIVRHAAIRSQKPRVLAMRKPATVAQVAARAGSWPHTCSRLCYGAGSTGARCRIGEK